MPQPRKKGQLCKQNKLDKSSNFAVNAEHATEEHSQSQSCFESKVGEGFLFIDLSLLFKLHSFRASQRYLAHKNRSNTYPTHGQGAAPVFFNLVHVVF